MAKKDPAPQYQIKVTLAGIKPPIWRRIVVPTSLSLKQFHTILQGVMGWTDSHMHHFIVHDEFYGKPDPEFGGEIKSEAKIRLEQALTQEKDSVVYEYDFGDGWMHKIILEKILPPTKGPATLSCTGGARACPPEDCGGIPGYENLLTVISDAAHPEHHDMLEWLGGSFDPEYFDVTEINKWLAG